MSFLGEIKRRKVFQVAAVYLVASWLIMQVVDVVAEPLLLPDWFPRVVIVLLASGFPIAIILSWAFDLTARGVERTVATVSGEEEQPETMATTTGLAVNLAVIGALALALIAVGVYVFWRDEPITTANGDDTPSQSTVSGNDRPDVLPNSVAVLLCDNLSPDSEDAVFAESIHEEILSQLMKIRSLTPIARTAVLQYADARPPISQIAEELRVESVMACTVRYAGDAIMVTARLIDPETNVPIWSGDYPGDRSDLSTMFEMQADIAMNIANALQVAFTEAEQASIQQQPTENPAAYDLYLRAIATLQTDRESALSLLDRATVLDPSFAYAYARMALYYAGSLVQTFGNPAADPEERQNLEATARRAASLALDIDQNLGLAHSALAYIDQIYWRWAEAEQAYERAREARPNDPSILFSLARLKSFQGDHDDAIRLMQRVVELNPTGSSFYVLASVIAHSEDPEAALAPAEYAVEIDPANPVTHLWLARIGSALDLNELVEEHLSIAERLLIDSAAPVGLASLAFTYSRIGDQEAASRVLEQLATAAPNRDFDAGSWVMGYLAQGDEDAAFEALQTVIERIERNEPDAAYYGLMIIKSNAQRHPVLDKPRFQNLRGRIGA